MQNAGRKKGGEKLSLKRGAWREVEVMKHRDVCVDPGNNELASLAFQPPFTRHFHPSLCLACSPIEFP